MAWMPALEEAEKQMHSVVEQWMNAKDSESCMHIIVREEDSPK